MDRPRISVLMSVYNGGQFLGDALEGLRQQTEKNWECILIDDASNDATPAMLARAAADDSRFRVITFEQNRGLTVALNTALEQARAPYFARQDADDISLSARLSAQADFLDANPTCALVGCAYEIIDMEAAALSVSSPATDPKGLRNQLKHRNPLAHGSLMFRADAIRAAGGYRSEFRMAQDYDLILRLAKNADIAAVEGVLYRLRLSPDGGSLSRRETQDHFARLAGGDALPPGPAPAPAGPVDLELAHQRYQCLAALHLIKSGRVVEARRRLSGCDHPAIRSHVRKLTLFSRLPESLRVQAVKAKHFWETKA